MNQLHVKNHFVPECYLKNWENSEKKVYVFRTLVNHPNILTWKSHSVSAIAYQRHLYTQIISGSESDEIEKWLDQEYESPANTALKKATSDRQLSSDDWQALIKFLAAQDVRTPARLLEHLKRSQKNFPAILQSIMNELKEKLDNNEIDALRSQNKTSGSEEFPLKVKAHIKEDSETGIIKAETYVGRSTWILSIKHLLQNTRRVLHKHKWSIVKPAEGFNWPTSDNPVVKLNYYSPGNYDLRGGWNVARGNIIFPIGPKHAMFVQIGDSPIPKGTILSPCQTIEFIKFIVENAHRKVFSINEDCRVPNLRKRIVDPEKLDRENEEIHMWHQKNEAMERKFLPSNRKV